mmetsp:Transcript_33349/g.84942  ORF Transcript_33349/g.84942 Transcript_33349/m.84942 type:complete len:512 (+) Transcript_33349:89-1624(+)
MSKEIVVRLVTASGRSRIQIQESANFADFQAEVEKRTGVAAAQQKFGLDPKGQRPVGGAPSAPLAQLGITNGAQLHLINQDASIAAQVLTKVLVPVAPEAPVARTDGGAAAAGSGSAAASSGAASSSTGPAAPKVEPPKKTIAVSGHPDALKVDPKFETFDSFIRNRRYDTAALPGSQRYVSGQITKGGMIKLPPAMSIKQQPYRHIDTLSVINVPEMENFIGYWQGDLLEHGMQRLGWMYGYYLEDNNYDEGCRAVLEGIYEPPQEMIGEIAQHKDDPRKDSVDRVMEACGLECIGWIFTTLLLDDDQLLSPLEIQRIGRLQNEFSTDLHFTKYRLSKFVSCAIRPDASAGGAPCLNPFMVSDQCCAMVRDGILTESTDRKHCVVREAKKNELISDFLVESKPTKKLLTDFFIVRVNDTAPKKHQRMFIHAKFPRENRPTQPQRGRDDLKKYFRNVPSNEPSWSRYADFHLLLYIAQEMDESTAIGIAECIRDRKEIPEGTQMLINSMVQ